MLSTTSLSIPTLKKQAELPPTPSSSYCHSVISKDRQADRDRSTSMTSITSAPKLPAGPKHYGSFKSMPLSDDTLSFDSAPPTPPNTTISPNDDDEGLYLLWTHQILREQGFRPSSCRTNSYHGNNDQDSDDDDDDDSSLSASVASITYPKQTPLSPTPSAHLHNDHPPLLSSFTMFISSCFCPSS
ncbi:hypothetical protein BC941DRAFT_134687 [Chlamydoabsidia padenii]|nr:hypothetical protein BC941DRAFT_134687 [Chlamydoabsidia padenii]